MAFGQPSCEASSSKAALVPTAERDLEAGVDQDLLSFRNALSSSSDLLHVFTPLSQSTRWWSNPTIPGEEVPPLSAFISDTFSETTKENIETMLNSLDGVVADTEKTLGKVLRGGRASILPTDLSLAKVAFTDPLLTSSAAGPAVNFWTYRFFAGVLNDRLKAALREPSILNDSPRADHTLTDHVPFSLEPFSRYDREWEVPARNFLSVWSESRKPKPDSVVGAERGPNGSAPEIRSLLDRHMTAQSKSYLENVISYLTGISLTIRAMAAMVSCLGKCLN